MHPTLIAALADERHASLLREAERSRRLRSSGIHRAGQRPERFGGGRVVLMRFAGALRAHATPTTTSACCA